MLGNRRLMGLVTLVAGSGLCLLATVGAESTYADPPADPPECPTNVHPTGGSGYGSTFGTLWEVKDFTNPADAAVRKFHLCEGDRFMFIRPGGTEKLILMGNLVSRWGERELDAKRTPFTGANVSYRLCVEVLLRPSSDAAPEPYVFKFNRQIVSGPNIDTTKMRIVYSRSSQAFNCDSESEDHDHGMAHAEDSV